MSKEEIKALRRPFIKELFRNNKVNLTCLKTRAS